VITHPEYSQRGISQGERTPLTIKTLDRIIRCALFVGVVLLPGCKSSLSPVVMYHGGGGLGLYKTNMEKEGVYSVFRMNGFGVNYLNGTLQLGKIDNTVVLARQTDEGGEYISAEAELYWGQSAKIHANELLRGNDYNYEN